jgi:hypothetical protein
VPFQVLTTAYEKDWSTVVPLLAQANFFIYEEGGDPRSIFFNVQGNAALNYVRNSGKFFELPVRYALPDGGVARVYQSALRRAFFRAGRMAPDHLSGLTDCSVMFGEFIQLTGIGVEQTGDDLTIRFRWKCTRRFDRDYWSFVHVVDAQHNVIGNLDHRLLEDDPPATQWEPDDLAIETLHFHSELRQAARRYRLEVGLYHPASGERLAILHSDFPSADGLTAAVIEIGDVADATENGRPRR